MYEYTVDESTFVGDGERMEYVLWILYNNRKSSNDSPNARSDPPCPSSPDIASSRVQSQDVYYSDNGISFVSQSSNVDTPKVSREAVTSPDILMINKDNQVQHSAQLYGANLSSAPYSSTQDISSLGILQKELARCNGAAYSVLPQFSHGMPSPSTSQVIEVYNQALMDVDPLVQNLFQLYDAELSSATNSSQNMASLEIHPATPNCNQAIPSTTQWGNGMLVDSLEMMEVDRRVLSEEGQLVQFSLMQLENMPQDNIPSNTFTRREELDLWDPKIPYCNQAIPSTTQLGNGMLATGSEMMEVDGRVLSNGGQPVQFPLLQLENMPQGNIPLNSFTWQEKLGGWQSSMNEVHPQQHAPQHQKDISLADMLYSNDYPQQLGDPYEAYTHQGALQTLQVQPYALWHDEGVAQADMSFNSIMQPEHHLMNNSQQQHARQHDEDDERPAYLLEGFKPEEELQSMQQLMNDSANC